MVDGLSRKLVERLAYLKVEQTELVKHITDLSIGIVNQSKIGYIAFMMIELETVKKIKNIDSRIRIYWRY